MLIWRRERRGRVINLQTRCGRSSQGGPGGVEAGDSGGWVGEEGSGGARVWLIQLRFCCRSVPSRTGSLLHPALPLDTRAIYDIFLFPPPTYMHERAHALTHLCTHAPLGPPRQICKSTSAAVPNLQPSSCVWYANSAATRFPQHPPPPRSPPTLLHHILLILPHTPLCFPPLPACQGWADEAGSEKRSHGGGGEHLQTNLDNDVVMDGCYTHKQACEEPRLVGEQWQAAGVGGEEVQKRKDK